MKVGVIGCLGMVGAAVFEAFQRKGFDVAGYDIKGEFASDEHYKEALECPIVFVCVPSPTVDGLQDLTAVEVALSKLALNAYKGVAVLKSTVLPGTTERLASEYSLRLIHNPEFLRAAHAYRDFVHQPVVLLGGPLDDCEIAKRAYRVALPHADVHCYQSAKVTETAKYMRNNFLTVKVAFANEYYALCKQLGLDYDVVKEAFLSQEGIERGHWNVPGPDGKRGFGGACFSKDVRAMIAFMRGNGILNGVLTGAEHDNQEIRPHGPRCEEISNEV